MADVAGVAPVSQLEAERALEELLASPSFSKSPRMARLLRFLVAQRDAVDATSLGELAIGLAVFDRDPATYFPAEDPIVRV
ncbi:MAG: hypothetical protein M3N23_06900, partial [Pseudomonadota bacterium]|nr:hypothetical protein [Pseudomonadota bacterium]